MNKEYCLLCLRFTHELGSTVTLWLFLTSFLSDENPSYTRVAGSTCLSKGERSVVKNAFIVQLTAVVRVQKSIPSTQSIFHSSIRSIQITAHPLLKLSATLLEPTDIHTLAKTPTNHHYIKGKWQLTY
jgi:hypothetical protein